MGNRVWLAAAVVALAGSAVACSGDEPTPLPHGSRDRHHPHRFRDQARGGRSSAVPVTFDLTNQGPSDHSFSLVRTDLAEDALPVADHVVEVGPLEVVAEVERVAFDAEHRLAVELEAGDYVMFCIIPGHYESDMHASFTVT